MDIFNVSLGGLTIEMKSRFDYLKLFCHEYLCEDQKPDFSVSATDEKIDELRESNPEMADCFLERDAIFAEIVSKLPYYNRMMLHGACITYNGKGYLFTAHSGTGKSTHISLWKRYLGDSVGIVNGDKPIFEMRPNGTIHAYDTPWCGKEGWNEFKSADVAGICFLQQGAENKIRPVDPEEAISLMLQQMFHPYETESTLLMLEFLSRMLEKLPMYLLECDMSEKAVKTSFEALTGEKYHKAERETTLDEINRLWRMPK